MAIAFPPSPLVGDIYSYGGRQWQWNGSGWQVYPTSFTNGLTINATTISGGTSGRILYDNAGTVGELVTGTGVATAIGNNTNSANGLAVLNASGALAIAQGGTNATSFTTNYVTYFDGTRLTGSSGLQYNGTTLSTSADATIHTIVVGLGAGAVATNTCVGALSLPANTTGSNNTSLGYGSLNSNTTGTANTAIGAATLVVNTTGIQNTAVGVSSLQNNVTGVNNTAVGYGSLLSNLSDSNTACGTNSLKNNTTGIQNTAVGLAALQANVTGVGNTSVGYLALLSSTANSNTALGWSALTANTTGANNIAIGYNAASAVTTGSNLIVIGTNAVPSSNTATNEVTIGNSSSTTYRIYAASWTNVSDERDKKNITDLNSGLEFINHIRPVSFDWNMRDGGKVDVEDIGFIAQELKQAQIDTGITVPNLVCENNPDQMAAAYSTLIPVLVKAIQELSAQVEELKNR